MIFTAISKTTRNYSLTNTALTMRKRSQKQCISRMMFREIFHGRLAMLRNASLHIVNYTTLCRKQSAEFHKRKFENLKIARSFGSISYGQSSCALAVHGPFNRTSNRLMQNQFSQQVTF